MAARTTRTRSPGEAFAIIKQAFARMADEPAVELVGATSVFSGDVQLDIKVRRARSLVAAPYRAFVTPDERVRAFADKGVATLEEVTAPGDAELERVDAVEVVLKCRTQLKEIVPNLQSVFPRFAFYSPGSGCWEVLVGTITSPDTGLRQFEIETELAGNVLSVKRIGNAW